MILRPNELVDTPIGKAGTGKITQQKACSSHTIGRSTPFEHQNKNMDAHDSSGRQ
jgi:hypothetical protein